MHNARTLASPVLSIWQAVRQRAFGDWLRATTFVPDWLPLRWRSQAVSYGIAACVTIVATALAWATVNAFPRFPYHSVFSLLATFLVALAMGSGPGLAAAVLSALLLDFVVASPHFTFAFDTASDLMGFTSYLLIAVIVVVLTSQEHAVRRYAQEAAQALQDSNRLLQESNYHREAFISIAGHELRSPLTAMLATLQLASRRLDRITAADGAMSAEDLEQRLAPIRDLNQRAVESVQRMNRLVSDLLDLSRVQTNHFEMRMAISDLAAIVEEVVRDQRQAESQRIITLERSTPTALWVNADGDRISQVATNFLTNAARYSPPGVPIAVRITDDGVAARVAVVDQGPGIAPHDQDRIWEPYARGAKNGQSSSPDGGLGMGLFISRAIVEQHGGRIGVDSVPGRGATFWFTLPRIAGPLPQALL